MFKANLSSRAQTKDGANSSPLNKAKDQAKRGQSGPQTNLSSYSYGGVQFGQAAIKDISSIVKNKDIFEKAQ